MQATCLPVCSLAFVPRLWPRPTFVPRLWPRPKQTNFDGDHHHQSKNPLLGIQPDAALSRTDRRSRSKVQRLPTQVDEMGDDRTDAYPVGRALPSAPKGAPPSPCSVLSSPTEQNHATPWSTRSGDHPRPATRGPSASGIERAPCCIALLKAATPCLGPRSSSRGASEASPAVDAKRPSATAAKRPSSVAMEEYLQAMQQLPPPTPTYNSSYRLSFDAAAEAPLTN